MYSLRSETKVNCGGTPRSTVHLKKLEMRVMNGIHFQSHKNLVKEKT